MNAQLEREPPRITIAFYALGMASIVFSVLFFGGYFYVASDIAKAFCLGAFFSGLLGSILLFGFAKIFDLLEDIRAKATMAVAPERGEDPQPGR